MLKKEKMFHNRKQREFIPDGKKDDSYWDRRRRNNEAAKRSREKRRMNDIVLEQKVIELSKENHILKAQLNAVQEKYGIQVEGVINEEQALTSFPQPDEILSFTKRTKLNQGNGISEENHSESMSLSPRSSPSTSHETSQPIRHTMSHTSYSSQITSDPSCLPHPSYTTNSMSAIEEENNHHMYSSESESRDSQLYATADENQPYGSTTDGSQYYEDSVLNLSSRKSSVEYQDSTVTSHINYGYSEEIIRRSPPPHDSGSALPLKLRLKTQNGERDAAHSLLALYGIKSEPRETLGVMDDYIGSTDERDPVSRLNSGSPADYQPPSTPNLPPSTTITSVSVPESNSMCVDKENGSVEQDNDKLKYEVDRLASELANIKYLLVRKIPRGDPDSDGGSR